MSKLFNSLTLVVFSFFALQTAGYTQGFDSPNSTGFDPMDSTAVMGNLQNATAPTEGAEAYTEIPRTLINGGPGASAPTAQKAAGMMIGQPGVSTELMAPMSVGTKSIPSGKFKLGFKGKGGGGPMGPWKGSGAPATSTTSVDLNIVDQ